MTGDDVTAWARTQIDVPWMHQARLPGVALDCAGLVICCARSLGLVPNDWDINHYPRSPDGSMLSICDEHMTRIDRPENGCVIVIATIRDPQHLGILTPYRHGGWAIIHASNAGKPSRVIETRLLPSRTMRPIAYYRLPGIEWP